MTYSNCYQHYYKNYIKITLRKIIYIEIKINLFRKKKTKKQNHPSFKYTSNILLTDTTMLGVQYIRMTFYTKKR